MDDIAICASALTRDFGDVRAVNGGVLVSLRSSTARAAQQRLSLAVMVVFVVPFIGIQALPRELIASTFGWTAENPAASVFILSGVLLAIGVLLVAAAAARFKRSALVID